MNAFIHVKFDYFRKQWRLIVFFTFLFFLFLIFGSLIPEGYDWRDFFSQGNIPSIWTPWTVITTSFLTFPLLVAITLISLVIRTYRYNPSPWPAVLACVSLPTVWVMILGNLDGLVLLGLMLLPFGAPLVLLKPQIAAFALLAKKSNFIAGGIWIVISLIIWGLWPLNLLQVADPSWKVEWTQDISLFPWGILLAIPLLWLSRKDEDLLMIAGSFMTPHLFPYHFLLIMPSLARMKTGWMIAGWLFSWSPLLANWLGPNAWHFGNIFALVMWSGIYLSTHQVQLRLPRFDLNSTKS